MAFWNLAEESQASGLSDRNLTGYPLPRSGFPQGGGPPKTIPASGAFALSANGQLFAVNKEWGEVDIWDLGKNSWVRVVQRSSGPKTSSSAATSLAFLPDGRLATVFDHRDVVLDAVIGSGTLRTNLLIQPGEVPGTQHLEVHSLAASAAGDRLAAAGIRVWMDPKGIGIQSFVPRAAELQVWDIATSTRTATLGGRTNEVFGAVGLDRTGRRVAGVSGVCFGLRMTGALQNSQQIAMRAQPASSGPLRVFVWEIRPL
jgi:hypothetical protein